MIQDVVTGRLITTDVRPIEPKDIRDLEPAGWRFNWRTAVVSMEVFKLVDPLVPDAILGLLGLKRCPNYVEVTLLESHPKNVGRPKEFDGVAGSLFAFAGQLSIDLGYDGFILIEAKTNLIEHYESVYGFERINNSLRMFLTTVKTKQLISRYSQEANP